MNSVKSEKEKMLAGQLYDASDERLTQDRQQTRVLIAQLNGKAFACPTDRRKIISTLLPNASSDISIEPPFYCDYGYNIYCGKKVYFNFHCVLLDVMPIRIGSHVLFGPGVQIYTATHPIDYLKRRDDLEYAKPISIGDDCWIGGNVVICPGVVIGERAIIGAGSVVTKNVAADTVVAGNPAKVIKSLKSV